MVKQPILSSRINFSLATFAPHSCSLYYVFCDTICRHGIQNPYPRLWKGSIEIDVTTFALFGYDSGCGTVGRAVASDTRGPRFGSRHRQILNLCTVNCIERTKINKKRPGMAQFWNFLLHILNVSVLFIIALIPRLNREHYWLRLSASCLRWCKPVNNNQMMKSKDCLNLSLLLWNCF